MRYFWLLAGTFLLAAVPGVGAQSQSTEPVQKSEKGPEQPSLAEVARLNRQKKQAQQASNATPENKRSVASGRPRTISNDQLERPSERRRVSVLEWDEDNEEALLAAAARARREREQRESQEEPQTNSEASQKADRPRYPRQEEDPEYYRQRLRPLRDELMRTETELSRLRGSSSYDYRTDSVVSDSDRYKRVPTISNTVKYELERLESKRRDLQKRITEIEEEAARNRVYL